MVAAHNVTRGDKQMVLSAYHEETHEVNDSRRRKSAYGKSTSGARDDGEMDVCMRS